MKDKGGRPSKYSKELADKICERVVEGKSLIKISKEFGFHLSSFFEWIGTHKEFSDKYARAKAEQADTLIEEILDISDAEMPKDVFGKIDSAAVNHARLKVDTRKWIAGKMRPKKYGEKLLLDDDSHKLLAPTIILKKE